jgi:hypothetical protein
MIRWTLGFVPLMGVGRHERAYRGANCIPHSQEARKGGGRCQNPTILFEG